MAIHELIGIAIAVVAVIVAYRIGYHVGQSTGHDAGFDEGRRQGKKEGSIRGYAVGFDRGRRQEDAAEEESSSPSGRLGLISVSLAVVVVLVLATMLNRSGDERGPRPGPVGTWGDDAEQGEWQSGFSEAEENAFQAATRSQDFSYQP
ncbi:MAG: hypothetical protein AAGF97_02080 [Planctomycetota bacterium]